jgi:hypothetical protein
LAKKTVKRKQVKKKPKPAKAVRKKPAPAQAGASLPEQDLHRVILLLVESRDSARVKRFCADELGMTNAAAEQAVGYVRQQIALAADYDRREEIGKAVIRFDTIYEESLNQVNEKTGLKTGLETALKANLGKCRLLGLNETTEEPSPADAGKEQTELTGRLDRIRGHLEPLMPEAGEVPAEELARLVSLEMIRLRSRESPAASGGHVLLKEGNEEKPG